MQAEAESFRAFLLLGIFCVALTIVFGMLKEYAQYKKSERRNAKAMADQIND